LELFDPRCGKVFEFVFLDAIEREVKRALNGDEFVVAAPALLVAHSQAKRPRRLTEK
jgi:hypothetical protein